MNSPILHETPYNVTIQTKEGVFTFFRDDNPIGACLYHYGEWSRQEFNVIDNLVTTTSVCLDIGANIGTHTVALSKRCNQGMIFAFEPQVYIFQALNANIFMNDCFNVVAYQAGVSDTLKEIRGPIHVPRPNEGNFNYGEFKNTGEGPLGIPCVRLDEASYFGRSVDFIKMDVEGHEPSALLSGKKMITKDKPHMYLEFNDHKGNDEVLRVLKDFGYNCYWHCYPKHNEENHNLTDVNIWLSDPNLPKIEATVDKWYEASLIAIHKDRDTKQYTERIELGDNIIKYLQRNKMIA